MSRVRPSVPNSLYVTNIRRRELIRELSGQLALEVLRMSADRRATWDEVVVAAERATEEWLKGWRVCRRSPRA